MALDPAVAAVRLAVRNDLLARARPTTVLVACSGGADSLALLAATVFEAHKQRRRTWSGVTVDHDLQEVLGRAGAARRRADGRTRRRRDGRGPRPGDGARVRGRRRRPARRGTPCWRRSPSGSARGPSCSGTPSTTRPRPCCWGSPAGSGGRSLAGMRRGFDVFRRPLLDITREQTEAACRAEGIEWWTDPHNEDPRFARSRVRHRVLPVLEAELGPGVTAALARTAEHAVARTVEALDEIAAKVLRDGADATAPWSAGSSRRRPSPCSAGCCGSRPSRRARRPRSCSASTCSRWRGMVEGPEGAVRNKEIQLPGHVTAYRDGDLLRFRRTAVTG